MDILEQLAANISSWPAILPRSAMVTIAAGTVTQAHNEIERLREENRRLSGEPFVDVDKPALIGVDLAKGEDKTVTNFGLNLSKVLFAAEPGLLANDTAASARAAAELAKLLGCTMAAVLFKTPDRFSEAMTAVVKVAVMSAMDTVRKALGMPPESTH